MRAIRLFGIIVGLFVGFTSYFSLSTKVLAQCQGGCQVYTVEDCGNYCDGE